MRKVERKAIILVQLVTVMGSIALASAIIEIDNYVATIRQSVVAATRLSEWSLADSAGQILPRAEAHLSAGSNALTVMPITPVPSKGESAGKPKQIKIHVERKLAGTPVFVDIFR